MDVFLIHILFLHFYFYLFIREENLTANWYKLKNVDTVDNMNVADAEAFICHKGEQQQEVQSLYKFNLHWDVEEDRFILFGFHYNIGLVYLLKVSCADINLLQVIHWSYTCI